MCLAIGMICSIKLAASDGQTRIDSLELRLQDDLEDPDRLEVYIALVEAYDEFSPDRKALQRVLEALALARKTGNDFARAKLLRLRGQIYNEVDKSDYPEALSFFDQSLLVHKRITATYPDRVAQRTEMVSTYNSIAYLYWEWGRLPQSLNYYDSTISLGLKVRELDSTGVRINRLLGLAHNSKGAVLWGLGSYSDAVANYFKAVGYFEQLGMLKHLSLATANIGLVYHSWGEREDAFFYFRRAIAQATEANDPTALGYALSNMGKLKEAVGQYDSALYYFQQSMNWYLQDNNENGVWLNLTGIGKTHAEMGEFDKSLDSFGKALQLAEDNNSDYWRALAKQHISAAYLGKGDNTLALRSANESNALAEEHGYNEIIKENFLTIASVYAGQKDYKRAYEKYKQYSQLNDSLFSEEKFRQISLLREQFDAEKRESENELLRRDRMLQQERLEGARLERFGYLALVIVLLAFAGYFVWINRKVSKINSALWEKNAEVTRQKEELATQADELKKSNEIKNLMFSIVSHDLRGPIVSLGGLVSLLDNKKLGMKELRQMLPAVAAHISNITNLTDNLLYWARGQMEGIKVVPQPFDLAEHISPKLKIFESAAHTKGIEIQDKLPAGTKVFADPYMVELVIRNLVSNAIKFSSLGDKVTIRASTSSSQVTVTVEDTGRGIPPESIEKLFNDIQYTTLGTKNEKGVGLGLTMSKHFVQLIGGEIWVESIFGKGATFSFTIPVSTAGQQTESTR